MARFLMEGTASYLTACRLLLRHYFQLQIPAIVRRFLSGDEVHGTRQRGGYPVIRAGRLLETELLDQVIIGNGNRSSLRELGIMAIFTRNRHPNAAAEPRRFSRFSFCASRQPKHAV